MPAVLPAFSALVALSTPLVAVVPSQTAGESSPVAYFDEGASAPEDTPLLIDVLANDLDADGDTLVILADTLEIETVAADPGSPDIEVGDLELAIVDGAIQVTPPADFHGSFVGAYAVSDRAPGSPDARRSATTTFAGTFTPVNDAPRLVDVGSPDAPVVGREEGRLTIASPLRDAVDPEGDDITLASIELVDPSLGGVALSETNPGGITFVPGPDVFGPVSITFTATDGEATSEPATIWVDITNVNDAPTAEDASFALSSGDVGVVQIPATDVDGDALTFVLETEPALGTAEIIGSSIRYTAARQSSGADSFVVIAADPSGTTARSTITVDVQAKVVRVASSQNCNAVEAIRGQALVIAANDCAEADDGAPLYVTEVTGGSASGARVSITDDGELRYEPAAGFTGVEQISFTVDDGIGNTARITTSVNVTRWGTSHEGASGREGDVVRTYISILDRAPDAAGLAFWSAIPAGELDREGLARQFFGSPEFIDRFGDQLGTTSDQEWVDLVYRRVFDRPADQSGSEFWQNQLRSGAIDRVQLLVWFAHSPEFQALTRTS